MASAIGWWTVPAAWSTHQTPLSCCNCPVRNAAMSAAGLGLQLRGGEARQPAVRTRWRSRAPGYSHGRPADQQQHDREHRPRRPAAGGGRHPSPRAGPAGRSAAQTCRGRRRVAALQRQPAGDTRRRRACRRRPPRRRRAARSAARSTRRARPPSPAAGRHAGQHGRLRLQAAEQQQAERQQRNARRPPAAPRRPRSPVERARYHGASLARSDSQMISSCMKSR